MSFVRSTNPNLKVPVLFFKLNFRDLILVFFSIFISIALKAEALNGTVVSVIDGDTIKVRLMGIDASEKSQAFGKEANEALSNYIYKKEVSVQYKKLDKYKRIVGKVTQGEQDICLQIVIDCCAIRLQN